MGVVKNISATEYPKQHFVGKSFVGVGRHVEVYFNYDTTKTFRGTVVRDDAEHPCKTIIVLEDGRVLTSDECQFSPTDEVDIEFVNMLKESEIFK